MAVPFSNTKLRVPKGFQNLLEAFAKEVLRQQPVNIYEFGAVFFEEMKKERDRTGVDDVAKLGARLEDRFYNTPFKRSDAEEASPEMHQAALTIQTEYRRHRAEMQSEEMREDQAAEHISAAEAGVIDRSEFAQASDEERPSEYIAAAEEFQAQAEEERAAEEEAQAQAEEMGAEQALEEPEMPPPEEMMMPADEEEALAMNEAATKIQTAFRKFKARKESGEGEQGEEGEEQPEAAPEGEGEAEGEGEGELMPPMKSAPPMDEGALEEADLEGAAGEAPGPEIEEMEDAGQEEGGGGAPPEFVPSGDEGEPDAGAAPQETQDAMPEMGPEDEEQQPEPASGADDAGEPAPQEEETAPAEPAPEEMAEAVGETQRTADAGLEEDAGEGTARSDEGAPPADEAPPEGEDAPAPEGGDSAGEEEEE